MNRLLSLIMLLLVCTAAVLCGQDKDGDGYPDDDETPMICIPDEGLVPRMRILPMQELMSLPEPGQ